MKLILWDWDNTLVDTFGAIFSAQNDMRRHYGLPEWSMEESKMAMNTSGRNLIKNIVGEEKAKEAREIFLKAYQQHAAQLALKPGTKDILKLAKKLGYINILASNKAGSILRNEVKVMDLTDSFDRIIGAEDTPNDKPAKAFTDAASNGFSYEQIISIGDGKADIQMARNYENGIGILVGTDPKTPEFETLTPNYACPDLLAVSNILKKIQ